MKKGKANSSKNMKIKNKKNDIQKVNQPKKKIKP